MPAESAPVLEDSEATNFALLLDLARETSSDRRRELLRQVTNVFVTDEEERSATECLMFEDIVETVAPVISVSARASLSEQIADSSLNLRRTARNFANDEIKVAKPVLRRSKALTEDDLVEVAKRKSQDHMLAITKREDITERLSGVLVDYGHDHVVGSLLENERAVIDRPAYESIAERAETSPILQKPFVERKTSPLDLLSDLSVVAKKELREKIQRRLQNATPEQIEAALAMSEPPPDLEQTRALFDAKCWIESAKKRKQFGPTSLVEALRMGRPTNFVVALAHLADVRIDIVRRAVDAGNMDSLAVLMKAVEIPPPIFNTIVMMLTDKGQDGIQNARKYAEIYSNVPVEEAQRAIRFWKVRQKILTEDQSD